MTNIFKFIYWALNFFLYYLIYFFILDFGSLVPPYNAGYRLNTIVYRFFVHNGEPLHERLILRLSSDIYTLYGTKMPCIILWHLQNKMPLLADFKIRLNCLYPTFFFPGHLCSLASQTYLCNRAAPGASAAGCVRYCLSEASAAWLRSSNIPTHQRDAFHPLPICYVQTYWREAAERHTATMF